jgi:two-component system response regulator FixJ
MTGPVVTIIDDDESVRSSLTFLVECAGHNVRAFDSAESFLEAIAEQGSEAGCIVTDVRMPGLSGVELVHRLKAMDCREPVIVITGHADVPMAIQAMKAGIADFIEKPFSDEEILGAISAALEARSANADLEARRQEIAGRLASLSQREREVLDALVEGKPNKVIAFDLGISARTVEVYRANLMHKMQVKSLSELVRLTILARD